MDEKEECLIPSPVENRVRSISDKGLSVQGLDLRPITATFPREDTARFRPPQVGGEAPDFELKLLSRNGGRSDKKLELSSLLGYPTGLIFGSHT